MIDVLAERYTNSIQTNGIFSPDTEKINTYEEYKSLFFINAAVSIYSNQAVSLKMSNRGSISIVAFQSNFHKAEA